MLPFRMAIKWDPVLTRAAAGELSLALREQRLRAALFDHAGASLRLYFRESTLDVLLREPGPTLVLREPEEPPTEARPFPCLLRQVTALPDERILCLSTRRVRGKRLVIEVIVELAANRPNAVLTEGADRIVRHVLMQRTRGGRTLRVGYPYEPPPASTRLGLDEAMERSEWLEILLDGPPAGREAVLLGKVSFTSRINAGALLGEAVSEDCADPAAELSRGYDLWRELREPLDTAPCVLEAPWGPQPYPRPLPGYDGQAADSILDALSALTGERAEGALPSVLVSRLEDEVRRAARAAGSLERRLEKTPDPSASRALGDLILARINEVPRGAKHVELMGFDGEPVEIELDPTLSPSDNAARHYDEAGRQRRALERLPGLLAEARARTERLGALLSGVRADDVTADEVRAALPPVLEPAGRGATAPVLPYRLYRSSGGLEIRVGRGAKFNDDLTFHHSRSDDVWLHARHAAGAHVILRWDQDGNPPARDLREAATLAALYSKARTSGSVPVDWTRRKHVRKPRKAAPGVVRIERVTTLFVEPDPSLEERLAVGGFDEE